MTHKRLPKAVLFALAAACVLTACSGEPVPVETSTPSPVALQDGQYLGFDTEEEAIAAAEEVYASYIDAIAAEGLGHADADPHQFLSGPAYEASIAANAQFAASGLTVVGAPNSEVLDGVMSSSDSVRIRTCDVLEARIINSEGVDVTPADRPEKQAMQVEIRREADDDLRIYQMVATEDHRC